MELNSCKLSDESGLQRDGATEEAEEQGGVQEEKGQGQSQEAEHHAGQAQGHAEKGPESEEGSFGIHA